MTHFWCYISLKDFIDSWWLLFSAEIYNVFIMILNWALILFYCMYGYQLIGQVGRMFTNGPGDLGSIPGRVIPKTLKWYLISPYLTLCNIRYVSTVKQSSKGKGVTPSPASRCCNYWKGAVFSHAYTSTYTCSIITTK